MCVCVSTSVHVSPVSLSTAGVSSLICTGPASQQVFSPHCCCMTPSDETDGIRSWLLIGWNETLRPRRLFADRFGYRWSTVMCNSWKFISQGLKCLVINIRLLVLQTIRHPSLLSLPWADVCSVIWHVYYKSITKWFFSVIKQMFEVFFFFFLEADRNKIDVSFSLENTQL